MYAIFSSKIVPQSDIDTSYEIISKSNDLVPSNESDDSEKPKEAITSTQESSYVQAPDGGQIQLHCIASSLDALLVARLTNHVRRKLANSGLQALAGTTDSLDGSDSPGLAVLFCIQGDYLVCLLDASLPKLEAFQDQLCEYIRQQIPAFAESAAAAAADADASPEAAAFATWEEAIVAALQRTVKLLRNVLPQLLTLVFVGCDLTVDCPDGDRQREVQRFLGQCRLLEAEAEAEPATPPSGAAQPQSQFPKGATLRINGRSVSLDFHHFTEFAKTWAAALLDSVDDGNPARLQQRILDLKLRASRDVNATKRLLAEAVGDYYALYRLAQALRQTGNAQVLLHNLASLGHPDECEAVACLSSFLAASCPLLT